MKSKTLQLMLLLLSVTALSQSILKPTDPLWKAITEKNDKQARAFLAGDTGKMKELYWDWAVMMPEHSVTRYYPQAIADYYKQWFSLAKMNTCSKTTLEVIDYNGFALETGAFTQSFTLNGGKPYTYTGKYMVLWRISSKLFDSPWIAAEIWGANAPFDDAELPQIKDTELTIERRLTGTELEKEVKSRNNIIAKLVKERKGAEHADLFLPDAAYMTYYTPILNGSEKIKAYFTAHEKPGDVTINTLLLDASLVMETKDGAIEFGFYSVGFTSGSYTGMVNGKSINVWKRNKDGVLMLYRQMVNHD
jgi:ketosteroid isomerase-like protein